VNKATDDMGLGKMLTTIALHLHRAETAGEAAGPTLVACPASLITNWQREIARSRCPLPPNRSGTTSHGFTSRVADSAYRRMALLSVTTTSKTSSASPPGSTGRRFRGTAPMRRT
jgi:hypothetical protein